MGAPGALVGVRASGEGLSALCGCSGGCSGGGARPA